MLKCKMSKEESKSRKVEKSLRIETDIILGTPDGLNQLARQTRRYETNLKICSKRTSYTQ